MVSALPYIPGSISLSPRPLARYLPPLPDGIVSTWLNNNIPKGAWVIDPFGASPRLVVEAAQAGYRVITAVNNPVARFLLEIAASRPSQAELRAALSELASAHRGEERIEPHIRSLYKTTCAACGQHIMADAFLWERGANAPYARIYKCPSCGDEGEHNVNESDIHLSAQFAGSGLHRARALEQVALPNDPDRNYVEEALSHYLPRAVYILFTLINRLDGLAIPASRRSHLKALLLHACDMGNTLWAVPTSRPRPRQLVTPTRFRENNIWLALEQGIEVCGEKISPFNIHLVTWPEEPPVEGGICLFEGRLKDLASFLEKLSIEAVIAAIPRHNQAFWTLSALWAGWLWGRDAVGPFKVVLRRRWYDWAWHTAALYMALQHLAPMLKSATPFFGLLSETEPGFITACLTAADAAGFALEGLAVYEDDAQTQILWRQNIQKLESPPSGTHEQIATCSIRNYLFERSEPASFLTTLAAGMQGLVEHRVPWMEMKPSAQLVDSAEPREMEQGPESGETVKHPRPHHLYTSTNAAIRKALTNRSSFTIYRVSEKADLTETIEKPHAIELEAGLFWLYENTPTRLSLSDQVEIALVRYLTKHTLCTFSDLQNFLFESFPGLLTPDNELIYACLESYGVPDNDHTWQMRQQDQPAKRRQDLAEVFDILLKMGERLGLKIKEEKINYLQDRAMIAWLDKHGQYLYRFYPLASAVFSDLLSMGDPVEIGEHVIVLPGSRANLVAYKLRRDPRLAECCKPIGKWRFLKYRHLRWWLENPLLTHESLADSLDLDPLTYSTPQLRLL